MNRKKIRELKETLEAFENLEKLGVTMVYFKSGSSIHIRDAIKLYKNKLKSLETEKFCCYTERC